MGTDLKRKLAVGLVVVVVGTVVGGLPVSAAIVAGPFAPLTPVQPDATIAVSGQADRTENITFNIVDQTDNDSATITKPIESRQFYVEIDLGELELTGGNGRLDDGQVVLAAEQAAVFTTPEGQDTFTVDSGIDRAAFIVTGGPVTRQGGETLTIRYSANDTHSPAARIKLTGGPSGTVINESVRTGAGRTAELSVPTDVRSGTYDLELVVTDAAKNRKSVTLPGAVTIDNEVHSLSAANSSQVIPPEGNLTVVGTASSTAEDVTFRIHNPKGNHTASVTKSINSTNFTVEIDLAAVTSSGSDDVLSPGKRTLSAVQGGESSSSGISGSDDGDSVSAADATSNFTIDAGIENVTLVGQSGARERRSGQAVTLQYTAVDEHFRSAKLVVENTSAEPILNRSVEAGVGRSTEFVIPPDAPDGRYRAVLTVADAAGNTETSVRANEVVVDNVVRTVSVGDGDAVVPPGGSVSLKGTASSSTGTIRIQISDPTDNDSATLTRPLDSGEFNLTANLSRLDFDGGDGELDSGTARVVARQGLSFSTASANTTFVVDSGIGAATIDSPTTDSATSMQTPRSVTIHYTATDPHFEAARLVLDGGPDGALRNVSVASGLNQSTSLDLPSTTAPGLYDLSLWVRDDAGNVETTTQPGAIRIMDNAGGSGGGGGGGGDGLSSSDTRRTGEIPSDEIDRFVSVSETVDVTHAERAAVGHDEQSKSHTATFSADSRVHSVTFDRPAVGVLTVVDLSGRPDQVDPVPGRAIAVTRIEIPDLISTIPFTVTKRVSLERVNSEDVAPADLVITRYTGEEWRVLDTELVTVTDEDVILEAESERASVFAVTAMQELNASFAVEPTTPERGEEVVLRSTTARSLYGEVSNVSWTVNGRTLSGSKVVARVNDSATLAVNLTVRTVGGRTASERRTIRVAGQEQAVNTRTETTNRDVEVEEAPTETEAAVSPLASYDLNGLPSLPAVIFAVLLGTEIFYRVQRWLNSIGSSLKQGQQIGGVDIYPWIVWLPLIALLSTSFGYRAQRKLVSWYEYVKMWLSQRVKDSTQTTLRQHHGMVLDRKILTLTSDRKKEVRAQTRRLFLYSAGLILPAVIVGIVITVFAAPFLPIRAGVFYATTLIFILALAYLQQDRWVMPNS
jgi:PGF-pre-PGF domain-containing protein